jgi:hypothetical protein
MFANAFTNVKAQARFLAPFTAHAASTIICTVTNSAKSGGSRLSITIFQTCYSKGGTCFTHTGFLHATPNAVLQVSSGVICYAKSVHNEQINCSRHRTVWNAQEAQEALEEKECLRLRATFRSGRFKCTLT